MFGRKGDKLEPGVQLAMPAFRSIDGPSADAVARAWKELFADEPPLELSGDPVSEEGAGSVMVFATGDRTVMFARVPMPIPAGDIESACERSWMWRDAAQAMPHQKSHAIVTSTPLGEPVEEALAVSRVIAAACKAGDAVGVYWGNGGQVHKPEFFVDAVRAFEALPVMLWVGVAVSASSPKGPFTLSTMGMRSFGHKEFEVIDAHEEPADLSMRVYELANYVLSKGPILKHGDTFGESARERIKVEHTTSKFRKGEAVIRLHVP